LSRTHMHGPPAQDNDSAPKKTTHRFEVAVDDVFAVQQTQTLDQRLGEPLDQIEAEALVVVFLDQLVQVETAEQTHTL
jgi:hypothetical protein